MRFGGEPQCIKYNGRTAWFKWGWCEEGQPLGCPLCLPGDPWDFWSSWQYHLKYITEFYPLMSPWVVSKVSQCLILFISTVSREGNGEGKGICCWWASGAGAEGRIKARVVQKSGWSLQYPMPESFPPFSFCLWPLPALSSDLGNPSDSPLPFFLPAEVPAPELSGSSLVIEGISWAVVVPLPSHVVSSSKNKCLGPVSCTELLEGLGNRYTTKEVF